MTDALLTASNVTTFCGSTILLVNLGLIRGLSQKVVDLFNSKKTIRSFAINVYLLMFLLFLH